MLEHSQVGVTAHLHVRRGGCMVGAWLWHASRLAGLPSWPNDPSMSVVRFQVWIVG